MSAGSGNREELFEWPRIASARLCREETPARRRLVPVWAFGDDERRDLQTAEPTL